MKNQRGWVGVGIFLLSIGLFWFEQTKIIAGFGTGFGMGMMSSGFQ